MPIQVECDCGAKMKAPDKLLGKDVKCPKCDGRLLIEPMAEPEQKPTRKGKRKPTGKTSKTTKRPAPTSRKQKSEKAPSRRDAREKVSRGRARNKSEDAGTGRRGARKSSSKKSMMPLFMGIGAVVLIGAGVAFWLMQKEKPGAPAAQGTQGAAASNNGAGSLSGFGALGQTPSAATTPAGAIAATPSSAAPPPPLPAGAGSWAGVPGNGHKSGLQAGNWDPAGKATVMAAIFGGNDIVKTVKDRKGRPKENRTGDEISDIVALTDGSLVVCGTIQGQDAIPKAGAVHHLGEGQVGKNSAFVAKLSPDGMQMKWFSVFPADMLEPQRMAVAPDGSICVGGQIRGSTAAPPVETLSAFADGKGFFKKKGCKVFIARISGDGSTLHWVKGGGPNQSKLTGINVDQKGRIYWMADPSGQGQATYVLRVDANGEQVTFDDCGEDGKSWCIYLTHDQKQLNAEGQFMSFYKKADKTGFDYDGPGKNWAKVFWFSFAFRHNGQVLCLPDGDIVVSASLFYRFKKGKEKTYPAFDYFLARYSSEGRLKWSTNLYQEGDSVHTPDQKPRDMTYDPSTDSIYVAVFQHGSNVYRFKGELQGDSGNMSLSWIGKVKAKDGSLDAGRYFMTSYQGNYTKNGVAKSPPYPKLSGNRLQRIRVDGKGRVYVIGQAGAKMFTTPNAYQPWPAGKTGGGEPCLFVLNDKLEYLYATVIGNGGKQPSSGDFNGLAITQQGVFIGGSFIGPGFSTGPKPAWAGGSPNEKDACLVRVQW